VLQVTPSNRRSPVEDIVFEVLQEASGFYFVSGGDLFTSARTATTTGETISTGATMSMCSSRLPYVISGDRSDQSAK
jgi:hypothetical protein